MKKLYTCGLMLLLPFAFLVSQNEVFTMEKVACNLSQPWEIKFGPDGYLWVTEANNYHLTKVDPATGGVNIMLDLSAEKNFANYSNPWPQGGLQGFAFHPEFAIKPYIYIAYVYRFDGCQPGKGGCFFKTKIVRYNYDLQSKTFTNETVIADSIPGSSDHNGGRMVIGPGIAGANYLFYSVGDMAAGHLGNGDRQHHGQDLNYYEGKILRFNLEEDADTNRYEKWIPNDNPFNNSTRQSAVWSFGHRNPQGLVFSPDGILYESEHGPYSDDEVNIIKRGNNYGFPLVMGYADGNYDGSKAGAGSGLPMITSELANKASLALNNPYSDPMTSFFAASKSDITTIYNNDYNNTPPYNNYYLQWPTVAPSGIDYYSSNAIPGWKNSLLVANLKYASMFRLKLSADGMTVTTDTIQYFKGMGRFRDIAISDDGRKIYIACDSVGVVKGAPGIAVEPANKGCILEFTYIPAGIDDKSKTLKIGLHPNPAMNNIIIDLPEGYKQSDIKVLNTLGQVQKTGTAFNGKAFDVSDLASGIYFMESEIDNQLVLEKFVIR